MDTHSQRQHYMQLLLDAFQHIESRNHFVTPHPDKREIMQAEASIAQAVTLLQEATPIAKSLEFSSHLDEIRTILDLLTHPAGKDHEKLHSRAIEMLAERVDAIQEHPDPEQYPEGYHAFIQRHLAKLLEHSTRLIQKLIR